VGSRCRWWEVGLEGRGWTAVVVEWNAGEGRRLLNRGRWWLVWFGGRGRRTAPGSAWRGSQ